MWQVIGQDRAVKLLKGSLGGERLCQAYLFVGPRQVGKGTLALDMARALNCTGEVPPCGGCQPCTRIGGGLHTDIQIIDVATTSGTVAARHKTEIGIDQIKELQRSASLPPFEGRFKVFIIDGAEYLSTEASNCLLKTLEEPPPRVVLVLLAAREDALLPTVLSRCFLVELRPLSLAEVEAVLLRRGVEKERSRLLARLCGGRLGWALAAAADESVLGRRRDKLEEIIALVDSSDEQRFAYAAKLAALAAQSREAMREVIAMWLGWWRDILMMKGGCLAGITNMDYQDKLAAQASYFSLGQAKDIISNVQMAQEQLELNANPRLVFETLMLSIQRKGVITPLMAGV
ncbi:MAG: DNA polymerase III subunit [Chloroflexi bacterium]|nr:DNA polymerase III subunit [Chloroflexota bacterium]